MLAAASGSDFPLQNIIWTMFIFFGLALWVWLIVVVLTDVFARPDLRTWERIGWVVLSFVLAGHERAVVPGFYGCDTHGNVKTFSRGGSDITGAIVARAVQADMYENWTDVSGCMMADPRIVRNPETIRYVTYRELRDLTACCAGAREPPRLFVYNASETCPRCTEV